MPVASSGSRRARPLVRRLAGATAESVKLLVVWVCLSLALGAGIPGAVIAAIVLSMATGLDRRPSVWRTFVFLFVTLFLRPLAFVWLFAPGFSWMYLPTWIAVLVVSYVIVFRWGLRQTGQLCEQALERVVTTPPNGRRVTTGSDRR